MFVATKRFPENIFVTFVVVVLFNRSYREKSFKKCLCISVFSSVFYSAVVYYM